MSKTIGVWAPSDSVRPVSRLYEAGLAVLSSMGFTVVEAPHCRGQRHYMSGTVREIAEDLTYLYKHEDVDVILPAIGGFSASQLLHYVDYSNVCSSKKLFTFSDSDCIGIAVSRTSGAITYHSGVDVVNIGTGENTPSVKALVDAINDSKFESAKLCSLRPGDVKGVIVGGNINSIEAVLGTRFEPCWDDKIIFIESCNSVRYLYRSLTHFINTGMFDNAKALVVGDCAALEGVTKNPPEQMLEYLFRDCNLPIFYGAPIGHDMKNIVIPVGGVAMIEDGILSFE